MVTKGISVIIPCWGELDVVSNSVLSAVRQWAPSDRAYPKFHVQLVDDMIEHRNEDGSSIYEYFLSDEFKKLYDTDRVSIDLIVNDTHKYQGESREIGFNAAKYDYFVLLDCDDMLAPNCLYRYWEVIEKESVNKPIAVIHGNLYSFDKDEYCNIIPGTSIWVQSRCYNRRFIHHHEIHFPTGMRSRQGEDYPFIRCLDYACEHDQSYQCITFDDKAPVFAYWFPNYNSLSRQDPHYGQHLSGWTMGSSLQILDYEKWFNDENGLTMEDDERYKMDVLNMNVYAMYNLLDWLFNVSVDKEWTPREDDWYALRDNVIKLKEHLIPLWKEYVPSDIYDMLYQVKHFSDVRFVESWLGNFFDFAENEWKPLSMNYNEMMEYCHSIKFNQAMHCEDAEYTKAFIERHKDMKFKESPQQAMQKQQMVRNQQMLQGQPVVYGQSQGQRRYGI